jgi:hypothetical protein
VGEWSAPLGDYAAIYQCHRSGSNSLVNGKGMNDRTQNQNR